MTAAFVATDATGAVVYGGTVRHGASLGLAARDALAKNDSNTFFSACDSREDTEFGEHLLKTGPTGTNVMDIIAAVVSCPRP